MAASQLAGSLALTYVYSMPYLGRYFVMTVWVLPKMALQERRWSPFLRKLRKVATIALMPEAVAKPASAPSRAQRRSVNSLTVGLLKRVYMNASFSSAKTARIFSA